jgi:hypothetical protein
VEPEDRQDPMMCSPGRGYPLRIASHWAGLLLCLAALPPSASAHQVTVDLSRDFWNFAYVLEGRVFDSWGNRATVLVEESWTDSAAPGDTITLGSVSTTLRTSRETLPKPRRRRFETGENYLFLAYSRSSLVGYGLPGNGFYRLRGVGISSFGDSYGFHLRPGFVSISELDSLAVHIGNDPRFDDREFFTRIRFPCGIDLGLQEYERLINSATKEALSRCKWLERYLPVAFEAGSGYISDSLSYRRRLHDLRNTLELRVKLDSCARDTIFQTGYPHTPIWSPKWLHDHLSSASFELPMLRLTAVCSSREEAACPPGIRPRGLVLGGYALPVLELSGGSMSYTNPRRDSGFPGGDVCKAWFYPTDSGGGRVSDSCIVLLAYPDIPARPEIPFPYLVLSSLAEKELLSVEMFHADSMNGKFAHIHDFMLEMDDSTRAMLR